MSFLSEAEAMLPNNLLAKAKAFEARLVATENALAGLAPAVKAVLSLLPAGSPIIAEVEAVLALLPQPATPTPATTSTTTTPGPTPATTSTTTTPGPVKP